MRPAVHPLGRLLRSVWLWPAVVMLGLGLFRLGTPVLWRDEVATWTVATRSLPDLLRLLQHVDASNGAYYLLMHAWTAVFGDSAVSLRLPSVLAMAGAAAFVGLAAERLFGGRVTAVGSGLLFCAVPQVSRFAQEARAYALVTCAIAAATWFLLRALERPGWRRWAPYCVAMAVAGVLHLVSFSTVAGQAAVVLLHLWRTRGTADRRLLWQYPAAVLVAALPLVPVVVLGARQSERQLGWIGTPTLDALWHFGETLAGAPDVFIAVVLLAVPAVVLPGRRVQALQALLLAVVPVVGVWLVSQGGTSYFVDRYLLFTVPAWAALGGGGVAAVYKALTGLARRGPRRKRLRVAGMALALALLAVPSWAALPRQATVRYESAHAHEPFRAAAGLIAAGYRPGDGLAVPLGDQSWAMIGPGVAYYLPADVRPYPVFVAQGAVEAAELSPTACAVPADCLGRADRIWLVVLGQTTDPLAAMLPDDAQALRARYGAPTRVTPLDGATLALLDRRG
ncbi:glycosyltransferase family 39 protein [Kitasatospora sp. NPDC059722]|uniref:glycosyltransferase family 39 protein n=1 Tax=unclassified Kitasatospora TaxID=2633591 RepID=UPI0036B86037